MTRLAIIDLGTNTFHLLILDKGAGGFTPLLRESRAAKIGEGGINRRTLTEPAIERALEILRFYREKLDAYGVEPAHVFAFGTSAIRNADNGAEFCETVRQETGIDINVIDGAQEAEYIYRGVRSALDLGPEPSLIMDIGGGSVEFIIADRDRAFWKQSFEIGGQRLMDKFMRTDPLSSADRRRMYGYFEEQLVPLANAVHQYAPRTLVGSSGSFDTLVSIYHHRVRESPDRDPGQTGFELPLEEFYRSMELLLTRNREERLAIPGMVPLRVNMVVVAVCLIDYVLQTHGIGRLRVSSYALKEGVLYSLDDA